MKKMFLAHYDRKTGEKQGLQEHLQNVSQQMQKDIAPVAFPGLEQKRLQELLSLIGLWHDIGKVMPAFQDYLKTGRGGNEKNHALISAAILVEQLEEKDGFAFLAMLSIAMHHTAMEAEEKDRITMPQMGYLPKQYVSCQKALNSTGISAPFLQQKKFDLEAFERFWLIGYLKAAQKMPSDHWFFALQYLFSKLIGADKLDSAGLAQEQPGKPRTLEQVETYLHHKTKGQIQEINDTRETIRTKVLKKVLSLTDQQIKEQRIFTYTAPTGTGKTLSSISAALVLAQRIESLEGFRPRLITAMPFINILEQTKDDYQGIFSEVLIHYGSNDQEQKQDTEESLQNRLLCTEAWESEVIITTFVQLFESLLSGKNRRVLKVNRLAGAIVILDEVQALPAKYYPLLGFVMQRLSQYYGTRFILMTATQPEIVRFANLLLPNQEMTAIELLEDSAQYYQSLCRTKLVPVMDQVINNETLVDLIVNTRQKHQSALVVVNTIAQSIAIYKLLIALYPDAVLYLSTNLTSVDRKRVIEQAKKLLREKIPFIMVATQTVEAGVDLDFDIGYRDMAPLESIIQVAGRINRSGEKGNDCPLYIFNTGNYKLIYALDVCKRTQSLLQTEIPEQEYHGLMKRYYADMFTSGITYDTEVYQGIMALQYEKIETFKLIQETRRISVIVLQDNDIEEKVQRLCELLRCKKDFAIKAQIKQLINQIGSYTVEIYPDKLKTNRPFPFESIYGIQLNYLVIPHGNLKDYYGITGFIAEETGAYMY